MTNDFAAVVYRMKLLGVNALRVQFTFNNLNQDLPSGSDPEFFPCLVRQLASMRVWCVCSAVCVGMCPAACVCLTQFMWVLWLYTL